MTHGAHGPDAGANRPLRVAVIGAGLMGEAHGRAYAARHDVRLVAFVSRTLDRARELAQRYGAESAYSDVAEMLETARPDGVSITTAEDQHVAPTLAALERGVGVLLEKPIASSLADATRIAEAAETADGLVVPAHLLRFTSPYRGLKAEVEAGHVGSVVAISTRRDRTRAIAEHYSHVHPAFLTAVHDIDLVLWLTGGRARRVRAFEHRGRPSEQADLVWAQIVLDTGAIASVSVSHMHPAGSLLFNSDRIEVYGTEGVAAVDVSSPPLTVRAASTYGPDWLLEPPDGGGAFGAEIAHFCECLRTGMRSELVSVDDALEGIRVADAMVRSAASNGEDVWLDTRAAAE